MNELVYEPHIIHDPLIPFIFRIDSRADGEKQPPNWHYNTEILFCIAGSGTVVSETITHTLEKGDIFVINSGNLHAIYAEDYIEYYYLIVDRNFCSTNGIPTDYVTFCEKINDSSLSAKFTNIIKAYSNTGICRAAGIRCAILDFLIMLRTRYTENTIGSEKNTEDISTSRIKQAMLYIRQNMTKSFTLDEIAEYVDISKYYFTREFRRITGQTVFEYINIVRCKEAKRLISEGMSISEAARACGFENMSYFSRTYKKCIGTSPSNSKNN